MSMVVKRSRLRAVWEFLTGRRYRFAGAAVGFVGAAVTIFLMHPHHKPLSVALSIGSVAIGIALAYIFVEQQRVNAENDAKKRERKADASETARP